MKHCVVLCENMERAVRLCSSTAKALGPIMRYIKKYPMLHIETKDDVHLYFTSEHYWFDRGGELGRHQWKILGEHYFEKMLDEYELAKIKED